MKHHFLFGICLFFTALCFGQNDYAKYVNPFIGTGGHGHTFPGPTVPFGMVQLSPDTRLKGWDGCSGYHYSDNVIYGFSHTHLSGTGCSDYGDILLMPTVGKPKFGNKQYASPFKKENERASAGYYTVFLEKPKVKVELTATTRSGLHKYTFPKSTSANIILDLTHRDRVKQGEINFVGNTEITGKRVSAAWANNQMLFYVIQFSKPFTKSGIVKANVINESLKHDTGSLLKAFVSFNTEEEEVIYARVGISAVSIENARKNLAEEQPEFDFEKVKNNAAFLWNNELNKINVESTDEESKQKFYTALYHCMISPNMYMDVDGSYRGRDFQIHQTPSFNYYTVFSLWDTYRALHPLLTLIDKERTSDFINTFIKQYEEGGRLPVWELSSCETDCMIGYHAIPVIAEAFMKDVKNFNQEKAYAAMKNSAMEDRNGLRSYKENGYIKFMGEGQNVSRTLEYAYDDWCIAMVAKQMGKTEDYLYFTKRALNYKNLFDPSTGFMRPKQDVFMSPFDPYRVDHNYTEGNAWQYSFYVPHDLSGQMNLLGGKEKLAAFLDSLFTTSSKLTGHSPPDITGMIGQYVHGNEPSHQIAYEYNYAGQPWKTQAMTRRIINEMYHAAPDGLAGNEDCGQMSAWYVMSALGFYAVCPGGSQYAIGSPIFSNATIRLENQKQFTVKTNGSGAYIQSAQLNGKPYNKSYLEYSDINNGGVIEFKMGNEPNRNWGSGVSEVPVTKIGE
jgi:predicted alpha-1,2-mannosidase